MDRRGDPLPDEVLTELEAIILGAIRLLRRSASQRADLLAHNSAYYFTILLLVLPVVDCELE